MALWKEQSSPKKEPDPVPPGAALVKEDRALVTTPSGRDLPSRANAAMESVIAADLTIEGKIEGSGDVRLIGKFKGDVHVDGNLTIETGAKVTGSVRATTVIIGGELEGNIDAASNVELLQTGVLNGDIKSGSLTVAAGSRMRGHAEFGWQEKELREPRMKVEARSTP